MSYVYYHKGLTIEIDPSIPSVKIDGCEIPIKEIIEIPIKKLFKYAKKIIIRSPGFKKREKCRNKHLNFLKRGVPDWNKWRAENPEIRPLLYDCDLTEGTLSKRLNEVNFANAVLINSDLRDQKLKRANFHEANLGRAKLHNADLTDANFCRTDLYETELQDAILNNANLQGTQLAKTNFEGAKMNGCKVYGASAWDLKLERADQSKIAIRYLQENMEKNGEGNNESEITVDNIEDAQLVFLLLNNPKIHGVLESVTSKTVLILGRFTKERILS